MNTLRLTTTSILVSLLALISVMLHDTKIDRLTTSLIGIPAIMAGASADAAARGIQGDAHTHVERVSLSEFRHQMPRLAPRSEHKKYFLQRGTPRGSQFFDSYNLPIA